MGENLRDFDGDGHTGSLTYSLYHNFVNKSSTFRELSRNFEKIMMVFDEKGYSH
jgi:hypothetical protein